MSICVYVCGCLCLWWAILVAMMLMLMLMEADCLTETERCLVCYITMSLGASNCSWTSCREGCTKELYDCTQIRVNYKLPVNETQLDGTDREGRAGGGVEGDEAGSKLRYERSPRDYNNYIEDFDDEFDEDDNDNNDGLPKPFPTGMFYQSYKLLCVRSYI